MEDMNALIDSVKDEGERKLRLMHAVLSGRPVIEHTMDPQLSDKEAERLCLQGDFFYYGTNVDYKRAIQCYHDASECDSGRACGCLGRMYEKGLGSEVNLRLAFESYKKGADIGDSFCTFALGKYYEKGIAGKDMDENERLEEAVKLYKKAAKSNNVDAMAKLGYMYDKGIFVEQDQEKAIDLYERAAKSDNPLAMNFLGAYYFKKKQYKEAVSYFSKGAVLGCTRAANNLGMCYEGGFGISKDPFEAVYWYKKAAEKGHPEAISNLGILNFKLARVTSNPKHYEQALKWLFSAQQLKQNLKETYYALGLIFQNGLGTDRDLYIAMNYFEEADKLGNIYSARALADSILEVSKTQKEFDKDKVLKLYQKGYKGGDLSAGYKLAIGCIEGKWEDTQEGIRIMKELDEKGSLEAKHYLNTISQ